MGKLIAITGPMFSGKTSELIRLVRRFSIAKKKVQIFNPMMDTRYSKSDLLSHDNVKIATERVSDSAHLIRSVREESDVIAIDEGHFFDDGIIDVCETLANQGKTVIINFLNLNFLADPFPYSTNLM
jgi:thymidine kinase